MVTWEPLSIKAVALLPQNDMIDSFESPTNLALMSSLGLCLLLSPVCHLTETSIRFLNFSYHLLAVLALSSDCQDLAIDFQNLVSDY